MRTPKNFFSPLALGAPEPLKEIPFRPSRMIHFFDPSNEKMRAKVADIAPTVDVLLGNLEDAVAIDNKEAADKISTRLKKKFPWIEARQLEEVFDEEGEEVAGRAFKAVIEWSKGKATLDTIPHEYGHLFIRIMKNHPVIKE